MLLQLLSVLHTYRGEEVNFIVEESKLRKWVGGVEIFVSFGGDVC